MMMRDCLAFARRQGLNLSTRHRIRTVLVARSTRPLSFKYACVFQALTRSICIKTFIIL